MDEPEGLEISISDILKAFDLAGPYATGKTNTARLENRWELALGIIDRALMESDRGLKLLELTAEMAWKPSGGSIIIGPLG